MRTIEINELQENLRQSNLEREEYEMTDEEMQRANAAVDSMLEFQKLGLTLGDITIRQLRDEGRRY